MSDTVFRGQVTSNTESTETLPKGKTPDSTGIVDIEVPYLDYATQNHHPLTVDVYKLGDTWNDPVGGFPKEIAIIENYVQEKVKRGELANSVKSIKDYIRSLEKMTNVSKEERSLIRIETVAAHIEFLKKTDQLKSNLARYANT